MTPNGTYLFMLTGADPALEAVFTRNDALTGWRCLTVTTAEAALAELGTHDGLVLDLIVLCGDRFLPLLAEIRAQRPLLPVIMQADERAAALRALRHGANDAVLGPQSTAHWKRLIASYARMLAPAPELRPLSLPLPMPESFDEIAGCNSGFRSAVAIAAKAARSRIPLLLSGESGTG
ncbi:MAG: sigma-54-dependent Fis family transcriptional regulator, partial [Alphaproteobacteria bacterium]|nr:sigma-54-dependent Fis family transcriptional regulator [Alphaproteobacteria bacterium]